MAVDSSLVRRFGISKRASLTDMLYLGFAGLPLTSQWKTEVSSTTETNGKLKDGSRGAGTEH